MSICPDNSTECLLRALLNDNSTQALLREILDSTNRFNWDPLNFAFTAAIGALALLIACVTVFQGLLAAGPGRIKASKVAIGPFAERSQSRFDFTELGLRTLAFVPSINGMNQIHRIERDFRNHPCCSKYDPAVGRSESGASWLRLLIELGVSDPNLWSHVGRQTDNLPTDISAAPAAGSVSFLAHLAAVADDDCIIERRPGSRFVTVIGKSSQLTFRDHPVLGSVAMYETYRESPKYRGSHPTKKVQFELSGPHSIGYTETANMIDLSHGLLKCRYLGCAVSDGSVQLSFGFFLQKLTSHCKHGHLNSNLSSVLFGGRGSHGARFTVGYIYSILFFTSVPSLVRAFPSTLLGLQTAMTQLSTLVSTWSTTSDEAISGLENVVKRFGGSFLPAPRAAYPFYIIGARARHHSSTSWLEDPPGAGWCTNKIQSDFRKGQHDLVYGTEIIDLCCDWLAELKQRGKSLKQLLVEDTTKVKEKLLTAIYLVDDWIRGHSRNECICAALFLIMDVEADLGIHPPQRVADDSQSNHTTTELEPTELNDLQVILVYRAVMFGALLELSADTSCLVDKSFLDSIVKVL
ncbi:uncharacterized protein Z518_05598 [Rhinocladiella mackenziei CBS 650.93]|uniref:Uncharacterized protein n=1 Tax=Rhinocladiella mackenziei CBS 650.93 TaxID=1442369 RepID=A0A0D2H2S0_9EURO|nr:uncharacterized protein Z518_05598 [Rhinocladiella mackenziei CBS 650.93]KIX04728.1 hypothetical protein Z518_05598 [Rhinocladiella mackenziei CBS 650.93]